MVKFYQVYPIILNENVNILRVRQWLTSTECASGLPIKGLVRVQGHIGGGLIP